MRSLVHVSSCTVRANLTPSNPRTPHCVRRAVSEFAFTGKPLRGLRKTKEDLKFLFSKRSVESTKRKIGVAGKIAAITAEAIVGDMMDEEHREYYALATRRGATVVKRRAVEIAGKQTSKIATKVAANLEFRFGRRTKLSRTFRRMARRNVKMIKRQQRWRRRDALLKERAKEVEVFRATELKKWQMAMDFDKGKKYWYHLETGEQRTDDPAIEAERERVRDAKKRRAMEVLRLTGRKKRKGGGKGGDEEDGASGLESDSDSEDEDLEAVNEILREELGGSDSDDSLDSDDIPLGAENWDPDKIKAGQKAAQAAGSSESDDDDDSSGESSSDEDDAGEGGGGESKTDGVAGDWAEYFDEGSQLPYWYSAATGETTWTDPNGAGVGGGVGAGDDEWETYYDDAGTPYYYNAATGETKY